MSTSFLFSTLLAAILVGLALLLVDPHSSAKRALGLTVAIAITMAVVQHVMFNMYFESTVAQRLHWGFLAAARFAVAGLMTAIALRVVRPLGTKAVLLITAGWALGGFTGQLLAVHTFLLSGALTGLVGGAAIGQVMRSIQPTLRLRSVGVLAFAWALAILAGESLVFGTGLPGQLTGTMGIAGALLSMSIYAGLIVAIGGAATLFSVRRETHRAT